MKLNRSEIAKRIRAERAVMPYSEFIAICNGPGVWRFPASRHGWHSMTSCRAMESFGSLESIAWKLATRRELRPRPAKFESLPTLDAILSITPSKDVTFWRSDCRKGTYFNTESPAFLAATKGGGKGPGFEWNVLRSDLRDSKFFTVMKTSAHYSFGWFYERTAREMAIYEKSFEFRVFDDQGRCVLQRLIAKDPYPSKAA